jgi:signal transduction histidine kinase
VKDTQDSQWAEFLDRLAHDLREPLRSIGVFSELLEDNARGRLDSEANQALDEILAGTAKMGTLLEGLSGYSMALRESAESVSAASLQSAFKIVVADLDERIRACDATVTAVNLPDVNVSLERLMQLLLNLIGNSLRFRSGAAPVIRVSAAPEAGMWAIQVEDNGIGIAPEDCEAIFRPFMRVEGKKYGGAGLGLSVCKKIVEAHGGTIRMESALGRGSVCTFTLPAAS